MRIRAGTDLSTSNADSAPAKVAPFHFDVPGGKWQQVISSPVSTARAASPAFHARVL